MPNTQRFILEKYRSPSSRHTCPECGKRGEFTRYIDTQEAIQFPDHVGKCNRDVNCGYHFPPKQYFREAGITFNREGNVAAQDSISHRPIPARQPPQPPVLPSLIPRDIFLGNFHLSDYSGNQFWKFLCQTFGRDTAAELAGEYLIGNSSHYNGATVFWQLDVECQVRSGKILLYDQDGHRIHGKQNWIHRIHQLPDFNLRQCFFGEHLLSKYPGKTVAIVESEKTAVIASGYFSSLDYVWVACGGLNMLTPERCGVLRGRQVVLFPDTGLPAKAGILSPFERWSQVADNLKKEGFRMITSDLLERSATITEKKKGLDLADYLLKFNPAEFRQFQKSQAA